MLKNSKGIKAFSLLCYIVGILGIGCFVYELVKAKGDYMSNLGLFVGLLVGGMMFLIVALTLNPPKVFNSKTLDFVSGLVLIAFAGICLAFLIFDCIKAFDWKTTILGTVCVLLCTSLGVALLKIAKQDINVDARIAKEEKEQAKLDKAKKPLTRCPHCGCKLDGSEKNCPNCTAMLDK